MRDEAARALWAADFKALDGRPVIAFGVYRAVALPVKGEQRRERPRDRAVLQLDDGTEVYLEALDARRSRRAPSEARRFDGKRVSVRGIAHALMPSRGQGLVAPCLSDVTSIQGEESR